MKISTKYQTNSKGTGQIVARGIGGKQKTVNYDQSLSVNANHGLAAGALILHVQKTSPELQYGDNLPSNVIRSLDAGYGTHEVSEDGKVHRFDV